MSVTNILTMIILFNSSMYICSRNSFSLRGEKMLDFTLHLVRLNLPTGKFATLGT